MKKTTTKQLESDIAAVLAKKPYKGDLYEIAEAVQAKTPRYGKIYFEDRSGEALWFDTFPAFGKNPYGP